MDTETQKGTILIHGASARELKELVSAVRAKYGEDYVVTVATRDCHRNRAVSAGSNIVVLLTTGLCAHPLHAGSEPVEDIVMMSYAKTNGIPVVILLGNRVIIAADKVLEELERVLEPVRA